MRKATIFYKNRVAGFLTETEEGEYHFQYTEEYQRDYPDDFITFSMPVREAPFIEKRVFPFFEGLIPEGWLLDIASKNWKLNPNDRMGLLLACCQNCIGAVHIEPVVGTNEA